MCPFANIEWLIAISGGILTAMTAKFLWVAKIFGRSKSEDLEEDGK